MGQISNWIFEGRNVVKLNFDEGIFSVFWLRKRKKKKEIYCKVDLGGVDLKQSSDFTDLMT
jgi:hypothetical protein